MTPERHRIWLGAILSLALGLRLLHLYDRAHAPLAHPEELASTDMFAFAEWAKTIAAGDWLGRKPYHLYAEWMAPVAPLATFERWWGGARVFHQEPLYPYVVALALTITGSMTSTLWLQAVFGVATVLLVHNIARRLTNEASTALIAAALAACYAPSIVLEGFLLREAFLTFSLALSLDLLMRLAAQPGARLAFVTGAALGLGVLLKQTGVILIAFSAVAVVSTSPSVRRRRVVVALLGGLAMTQAPLIARNFLVGAPLLSSSTRGPETIIQANSVYADPALIWLPPANVYATSVERGHASLPAAFAAALATWPEVDRGRLVLRHLLGKLAAIASDVEHPNNENFYYYREVTPVLRWLPTWAWVFGPGVIGLILMAWTAKNRAGVFVLGAGIASVVASLLVTVVLGRYRAPLGPLLAIPAAYAITQFGVTLRITKWRALLGLFTTATLVAYSLFATIPRHRFEAGKIMELDRDSSRMVSAVAIRRPQEPIAAARGLIGAGEYAPARRVLQTYQRQLRGYTTNASSGSPAAKILLARLTGDTFEQVTRLLLALDQLEQNAQSRAPTP